MSHQSNQDFLQTMLVRYRKASRAEKRMLLDSVCEICGYHRKSAIRLLHPPRRKKDRHALKSRGRNPAMTSHCSCVCSKTFAFCEYALRQSPRSQTHRRLDSYSA